MEHISKYSDVFLASFVVLVVGMMIIPLPTVLLDVLLTFNIAAGITILLVVLYISSAIRLASFPSILLIATLFRLALNVSTTRLILLNADAGNVIEAFGHFVVQGNIIVGAIVFVILTLVNFIVVSKGSERVAEVSARFTLDAMPGKQMAIDADLRSGSLDLGEAKVRRRELSRESQLFGAMDGAMKFVKGDAIAGILITCVNVVGGVAVGIIVNKLDAGNAIEIYGLLTIGDGLLSQIPALIVSVAAGLMVTRVEPEFCGNHLGKDICSQILSYPKALIIVAVLLFALGIVPGLPLMPFWVMSLIGIVTAMYLIKQTSNAGKTDADKVPSEIPQLETNHDTPFSLPADVSIYLGNTLTKQLDVQDPESEFYRSFLPELRQSIFLETGVNLPGVKVCGFEKQIPDNSYEIHILDTPVYRGVIPVDKAYVDNVDKKTLLSTCGTLLPDTIQNQNNGMLVPMTYKERLRAAGFDIHSGESLFLIQLKKNLKVHLHEFIGLQEVKWMCDELEKVYPDSVAETIPGMISYQRFGDVLRRLVNESICIRDLKRILEAVSEFSEVEPDNVALTDKVRVKLSRQIHHRFSQNGRLEVFLMDPELEALFQSSIHISGQERYLAMPPDVMEKVLQAFKHQLEPQVNNSEAVILTIEQNIRYVLWRFLSQQNKNIHVLSAQEMPPGADFMAIGSISI
jgi:type III secretion protein V